MKNLKPLRVPLFRMFLIGLKLMLKFVFLVFQCLDLRGRLKTKNLLVMESNNYVNACRPIVFRSFNPSYSKFNRVEVSRDGVLRPSFEFVEYSAAEDVKSSEFSLGNLIAIGAVNGMQYVSMSLNSDMNFVDDFAKSYQSITENV